MDTCPQNWACPPLEAGGAFPGLLGLFLNDRLGVGLGLLGVGAGGFGFFLLVVVAPRGFFFSKLPPGIGAPGGGGAMGWKAPPIPVMKAKFSPRRPAPLFFGPFFFRFLHGIALSRGFQSPHKLRRFGGWSKLSSSPKKNFSRFSGWGLTLLGA